MRIRRAALAAALTFTPMAATAVTVASSASPAAASASNCWSPNGNICEFVNGSGTWASNIGASFNNFTGDVYQVEVWGSGFYYSSPGFCGVHTSRTIAFGLNRNLPAGSYVTIKVRTSYGVMQRSFKIA